MNQPNTMGDVARDRYPRLIRAVQSSTGLSEPQAANAVVEYHDFGIQERDDTTELELQALGGPLAVICLSVCRRHRRDPRERRL
jgi:hypothetical protein